MSKILPSGEVLYSIYDDVLTRSLNSVRIGRECGKYLLNTNNVFIGQKAGYFSKYTTECIYIGYNAGSNITSGYRNIILGYDKNTNNINNIISIGYDNTTDVNCITIGNYNYGLGISNISLGYNNTVQGNNVITLGKNNIIHNSIIFYHNLLYYNSNIINNDVINILGNSYNNLFYNNNDINYVYSNIFNTLDNKIYKKKIINIKQNNLSHNSYIINGLAYVLYTNTSINTNINSSNIILPPNSIYNLINKKSSIEIPISYVKRIARPYLDSENNVIFEQNGIILDSYKIYFYISTPPLYGEFENNIVNNIDDLVYNNYKDYGQIFDKYGITPYVIINNEYIKGIEKIIVLQRTFGVINEYTSIINPSPNFSKEIDFIKYSSTAFLVGLDYVFIKDNILECINYDITDNLIFSVVKVPNNGFISDLERNPIASFTLSNIDNIIYQNYNNVNYDYCSINISYGYNFASISNITLNFNIINSNTIYLNDKYIYTNNLNYQIVYDNIKNSDIPLLFLDNQEIVNLNNDTSNIIELNVYFSFNKDNQLTNYNYNNLAEKLSYNLYNNYYISSNIIINKNKDIDYQFIRYDINKNLINEDFTISFNISPTVLYNELDSIYNFNVGFYYNDSNIFCLNYNQNNYKLNNNEINNIKINNNYKNYNINNIRLEYYLSSNITSINTDKIKLYNYFTNLIFTDFYIIKNFYDTNNYNIISGLNNDVKGLNNIVFGKNTIIAGDNSIVLGNDNSDNAIFESIIIGGSNFKQSFAQNAIVIGNNNISNILFDNNTNPIIIGNNINDNRFSLNIDNVICKYDNNLFINTPVSIGYKSKDINNLNINDTSLNIRGGINLDSIKITNSSNYTISLNVNNTLSENVTYTLPILPSNITRVMLTTDINGNLYWNEIDTFTTNNIITDDIITKNIIATGTIIGDGHNITNINLSDKTTDELKEGASNLYYTTKRINTAFDYNFSNLTTDALQEGSSNLYYTINRANSIFTCNLQKITSDDVAQGSNNLYFNYQYFSNIFIDNISKKTTDILKEGSNNLYYTYSRFVKQFNSNLKTINTDQLPEGTSNLYYTNDRENKKFVLILNSINTDNIKEGSSNLYYTLSRINIDFQNFLSKKTTDNIPQGTSNLYYNVSNISILVNSNLNFKTTDDVKEGTSNFYYTLSRFNIFLHSNTTDNVKEGSSNFFFTKERFLNSIKTINSDYIKQGTSNFYFNNDILTANFYSNLSNVSIDYIKQGTSNTFIVNNTINNNLIVDGIINASNIIIQGCNLLDIYNNSINNLNSNYAKSLNNNYYTNEVIINTSNKLNFNLNIYNNQSIKFNRRGPPILVVGSNVGINNAVPRYNLDIYGITNSTYFRGDGSMLWNLNLSDKTLDEIKQGTSNLFISSNTYNNDLTILGTLYASNIFLLNGLSNIRVNGGNSFEGDLINISNINISNYCININVDFSSNNQGITINNSGPPFIVVDNKVGINNLLPRYNLDVKGYTFSDYFIGDGSMLWNLNLNNNNLDQISNGTSNFYITSNIYNNNLTIKGDLYTCNGIFEGDIIPYENNTYSLGSSSSKWLDLYISSNININGISLLTSNNVLEIINNNTLLPSSLLINELILINNKTCNYSSFSLRDDGTLQFSTNNNGDLKSISYNDLNDRPFINFSNGIYNCNIVFLNDLIATNLSGFGSNIKDINWNNLTNIPGTIINSNILNELLSFYISSNVLSEQNYINSNSINDIIYLYLSSNTLNLEGYINSNSLSNVNINLGFDTVNDRNDAINSLTFISPLLRNSNIINLKYNPDIFVINEKEQLTFSPDIEIIDNIKTFKFQLKQGHLTYPDLWYYQINISDYSKTFLLDEYEYNIFNITSWSDKDLNAIYSSLVIITNQDNGIKRISANNIFGEAIELDDGLETMEGWQLDNDINYLTWFSTSYKTIYNILVDNINSTSNVTKITNKPNYTNTFINNYNSYIGNVNNISFNTNTYINFNSNIDILNIYGNYNLTYLNGNSILVNNDLYYQNLDIEPAIWYKFDNNLTYDSGTYNNNLNIVGNGGIFDNLIHKRGNGSVYFDNVNSYYNSSFTINFNLPLSFSFWFKIIENNINLVLYGGCISFDINETLNVHITFLNETIILSSLNNINKGLWYYIVLTISNDNCYLYLNNIIQSIYNNNNNNIYENSIMNIKIGCLNTYIDDFRIYEKIINNEDIKKLYFNSLYYDNSYPLSLLPIAWYKFDLDYNLGYDFSGNNNLLINNNSLFINGLKGINSLYINNSTLYGDLNFNLNNSNFCICMWVYCFINDGIIFQLGNLIIKFLNNKWYFIFNNEITYSLLTYEEDIGNWCHLVFTFTINNKIKNIYRNSQKINLVNFISSYPLDNSSNLTIGLNWKGYIDDLRIYKEILLPYQIDELYTGNVIINNGIVKNDNNKCINICNYTNLNWYNGFRTDYFNIGDGIKKFDILFSLYSNNVGNYSIYYDIYDNNDIKISKNIQQIFINTINNHLSYSYSFILQNTIIPYGIYYMIIYNNCLTDDNDYLNINLVSY